MSQNQILLLAIEAANIRLFQARYAYDNVNTPKTYGALLEAEKLVAELESLYLSSRS